MGRQELWDGKNGWRQKQLSARTLNDKNGGVARTDRR
jgi:hypothetical protein